MFFFCADHNNKIELVKRRYKEFVGLDVKLRQFHGDIQVQLPSKKAFRNMEKAFVETRIKELEQYLGSLITYYGVQDSQILASFLSPDSDPTLFLPESVTGKMKKAVSTSLKRDVCWEREGGGREGGRGRGREGEREGGRGRGREGGSVRGREGGRECEGKGGREGEGKGGREGEREEKEGGSVRGRREGV